MVGLQHKLRPPFAQPNISRSRKETLFPPNKLTIPHLSDYLSMAENDLAPDECIPRPVLKFYSLKRCIVNSMVQHLVCEFKRLEFRLRIPDHKVGIKARANA